jgi:asparagine synthase (glutamine-hydrolysing)
MLKVDCDCAERTSYCRREKKYCLKALTVGRKGCILGLFNPTSMPPVFGIFQPNLKQPDPILMGRMTDAASYIVPRHITEFDGPGLLASAALKDNVSLTPDHAVIYGKDHLVIVADASLYNRKGLAQRLGLKTSISEAGDAELILLAYEKWGSRCPGFLYGDFAFIIFNTQTGEFFGGRDPLGVRPMFYTRMENTFIFASELRLVLAVLDVQPEVQQDYLLDSLVGVKTLKNKTPYESIFRLSPGHYMEGGKDEIKLTRYWMPDVKATINLGKDSDYIAMFRELLVNAVNMRCEGVTSLASELSGGLDSSAITGVAADFASSQKIPFNTFSNVFPENTGFVFKDEREFIHEMLSFKGLKGIFVDHLGKTIPELLAHTLDIQGTYVQQNFNMMNHGLYKAAAEAGSGVLLSGFGGDELVSARTAFPWNEMILKRQWSAMVDELFSGGVTAKSMLKPGLITARFLYSRFSRQEYSTGVFTPELLARRLQNLPIQPGYVKQHNLENRYREKYRFPKQDILSLRQLYRINMDHLPQRMEYCYTAAAQFGLEYRYPLLDINLVLACLAFPARLKQHSGINRYLFRESVTGFVPEKIRQRNDKSGTTIPQTYFSLIQERENIMSMVNSHKGNQKIQEIFDLSRFPKWYDKLVKREEEDLNSMNPGAFYTFLMMLMYYGKSNYEL